MVDIAKENAVFKYAAGFLPKHKVDIVAQFADKKDIYVLDYACVTDIWVFSGGLVLSTKEVVQNEL